MAFFFLSYVFSRLVLPPFKPNNIDLNEFFTSLFQMYFSLPRSETCFSCKTKKRLRIIDCWYFLLAFWFKFVFLTFEGQALQELSKDKPSMKQVESHTTNFIKTLEGVESGLTKQINYLTQVSTGETILFLRIQE